MKFKLFAAVLMLGAILVIQAAELKVSRMGQSVILNQGGSNTTSGSTVVVSDSPTNEFRISVVTATVSGAEVISTNTFTQPYLATPTIFQGTVSGQKFATNVVATVTTSNLIVSGLLTNVINNVPFIIYGYKNTGVFE